MIITIFLKDQLELGTGQTLSLKAKVPDLQITETLGIVNLGRGNHSSCRNLPQAVFPRT